MGGVVTKMRFFDGTIKTHNKAVPVPSRVKVNYNKLKPSLVGQDILTKPLIGQRKLSKNH